MVAENRWRGQRTTCGSQFSPTLYRELNSGHQGWQQVNEPSCQSCLTKAFNFANNYNFSTIDYKIALGPPSLIIKFGPGTQVVEGNN